MKRQQLWMMVLSALLLIACGDNGDKTGSEKANQLMESTRKAKNYDQMITLADSLESNGELPSAEADYWRGYANDRMDKTRMAEFYWKTSMETAANYDDPGSTETYAKSASRLVNLLTVKGDYERALKMALPASKRLEELGCDTISDYVNLLIYIGCCQAALNNADKESSREFEQAYQKHLGNIGQKHDEASYKNAIAGLINIAYACIITGKYDEALKWTSNFGKLLQEYEQRPSASPEYIDKQLGRFDIYQAQSLEGLGKTVEAAKVYDSFKTTRFSKTHEGRINANDYLISAKRWEEAADNYQSLDAMLDKQGNAYTVSDIQKLLLKKFKANQLAGRRDSAFAVATKICNSLDDALALANKIESEEQASIVKKMEQIGEQQTKALQQKQMEQLGLVALIVVAMVGYIIYRRIHHHKLHQQHNELRGDYEKLESNTVEKASLKTEQSIALNIQQALSHETIKAKDFYTKVEHIPGEMAGDSFYDLRMVNGKLVFCIGNTTTNGAGASAISAMVWAQFRAITAFETEPERIMAALNETNISSGAVNLLIGTLEPETSLLRYCNAGHHAPILLNDGISLLPIATNATIGTQADHPYQANETTLDPGDMLLFYSEGITQAINGKSNPYGEKRLRGDTLQALKLSTEPTAFLNNLLSAIRNYTGDTEQTCDQTLMLIGR